MEVHIEIRRVLHLVSALPDLTLLMKFVEVSSLATALRPSTRLLLTTHGAFPFVDTSQSSASLSFFPTATARLQPNLSTNLQSPLLTLTRLPFTPSQRKQHGMNMVLSCLGTSMPCKMRLLRSSLRGSTCGWTPFSLLAVQRMCSISICICRTEELSAFQAPNHQACMHFWNTCPKLQSSPFQTLLPLYTVSFVLSSIAVYAEYARQDYFLTREDEHTKDGGQGTDCHTRLASSSCQYQCVFVAPSINVLKPF